MRDGTRLATDIYRPARDGDPLPGPFPTILCRTPYDKSDARYEEIGDFFTPQGYVTVLQDLRGRYRSEGFGQYFHVANINDGLDGYDTVEWIAAQPWSNKRVGAVGSSFAALVQTRMAFHRPPHLTAIWPDVTPINSYHHQSREGGAMQMHMFWALYLHAQDAQEIQNDPEAQDAVWNDLRGIRELLVSMPFQPGQTALSAIPNLEKTLFDYYHRGEYDSFWEREYNDFERNFERHADIPGTYSSGWYDPYAVAVTGYFAAMVKQNASPQRLVMGPWNHVGMRGDSSFTGDVDFGSDSVWGVSRYFEEQRRFFDAWLRDESSGKEDGPPVSIFVMGGGTGRKTDEGKYHHGGRWRREWEWPLARTRSIQYHFHSQGLLSTDEPDEESSPLSFTYDPTNPVPTIGGSLCGIMELPEDDGDLDQMWSRFLSPVTRLRNIVIPGPAHQKESADVFGANSPYQLLADRPDVLVFQTSPLEEDLEVTGSAIVTLWISSSTPDTDFTAKLIDLAPANDDYPDGYAMNLVDSVIRTRYRNSWEQEELMEPGEVYRVQIPLPPTSNLFQAGHRIRIDISSSNFPRLDLNPNTGEPMGRHTHTVPARNTVYMDKQRPSGVLLPTIPV
ncbi:MAG: CocE/NonD family hydrolase [Gemmatimonadetes bacterium]|nr:CocE/NonD family hydrolase [Gemmatimonadota bacterium]